MKRRFKPVISIADVVSLGVTAAIVWVVILSSVLKAQELPAGTWETRIVDCAGLQTICISRIDGWEIKAAADYRVFVQRRVK